MSKQSPLPIADHNILRAAGRAAASLSPDGDGYMSPRQRRIHDIRYRPSCVGIRGLAAAMARRRADSDSYRTAAQGRTDYSAPVLARIFGDADTRADIAYALAPLDGHSMGATYILRTSLGRSIGMHDATRNYARSCQWRATHGVSTATLSRGVLRAAWRAAVATHGPCRMIGGLPTWARPAPRSNPDAIRRAWWLESDDDGRKYDPSATVRMVAGYIVRDYHAATRAEAEQWLAEREAQRRAMEEQERRRAMEEQERRNTLAHTWATFGDSLRAGNCEPGTRAFAVRVRYGLDRSRAVSLRALVHVARRCGAWEASSRFVVRLAAHLVPGATLSDLEAIAR